jgi:catalase (peroxidase I)
MGREANHNQSRFGHQLILKKLVDDFVAAWNKVMSLNRFDWS